MIFSIRLPKSITQKKTWKRDKNLQDVKILLDVVGEYIFRLNTIVLNPYVQNIFLDLSTSGTLKAECLNATNRSSWNNIWTKGTLHNLVMFEYNSYTQLLSELTKANITRSCTTYPKCNLKGGTGIVEKSCCFGFLLFYLQWI